MIEAIADFIEREAGHVLIGLGLIGIGALLVFVHIPKAEDVLPFALGLIARSMVGEKTR